MALDIHTIYFIFALFNFFSFIFFLIYVLVYKEKRAALFIYILSNAAMSIQWLLYSIRTSHNAPWLIITSNLMGILGITYVVYSLFLITNPLKKRELVIVTLTAACLGIVHGLFIHKPENVRITLYSYILAVILLSGTILFVTQYKKSKLYVLASITSTLVAVSLIVRGLYAYNYSPELRMHQSNWANSLPSVLYFLFYYFDAIIILLIIKEQKRRIIENDNKELQNVNATKNKLISVMAHDLRNHFNAILGFSNILKEADFNLNSKEGKQYINILNEQAEDTNNLLESLLMWSRTQSNQIIFMPEKIDLEVLFAETLESLKNIGKIKNIKINYSINVQNELLADKNMLTTILRNLVSNSIKFTPSKGSIDIIALERLDNFEFIVKDNGIGLKEENKKTLFKQEVKKSTPGTNNEKGTGLGLLLCKEFIEKHKGEIWVNSKPGKGSEFIFTIPKQN